MKIAIIDRDGTLNALGNEYIASPDEWIPIPGALEAVARLSRAGWHLVVATNQPGLGRGVFDVHALNAIHSRMLKMVLGLGGRIDAVFFCPHSDAELCSCRKPAPGLMEQIRERFGVEATDILAVGSSASHLQAAAAICIQQLHLVCTGAAQDLDATQPLGEPWPAATRVHSDLDAFADFILTAQATKAGH